MHVHVYFKFVTQIQKEKNGIEYMHISTRVATLKQSRKVQQHDHEEKVRSQYPGLKEQCLQQKHEALFFRRTLSTEND